LRIFVRKMLGASVLNPKVIPSVLKTRHVHVFAGVLSKMRETNADRTTWNSGKHFVES
jgi:hypothetical protein